MHQFLPCFQSSSSSSDAEGEVADRSAFRHRFNCEATVSPLYTGIFVRRFAHLSSIDGLSSSLSPARCGPPNSGRNLWTGDGIAKRYQGGVCRWSRLHRSRTFLSVPDSERVIAAIYLDNGARARAIGDIELCGPAAILLGLTSSCASVASDRALLAGLTVGDWKSVRATIVLHHRTFDKRASLFALRCT